jgi:hypothetical protein
MPEPVIKPKRKCKPRKKKRDYAAASAKRLETMKSLPKKPRPQDVVIAQKKIQGKTSACIARELDMPVTTVKAILNREEVQAIINNAYSDMVNEVPNVVARTKRIAAHLDSEVLIPGMMAISWDANKSILQSTGIFAGNNQSIVHNTFINQQNNSIIPPLIAELMAKHFGGVIDIKEVKQIEGE